MFIHINPAPVDYRLLPRTLGEVTFYCVLCANRVCFSILYGGYFFFFMQVTLLMYCYWETCFVLLLKRKNQSSYKLLENI